jgi:hypothetical protein
MNVSGAGPGPTNKSSTSIGWSGPILLSLALFAIIVGGLYTDRWAELPHPLTTVSGWRWWFTPVERNAFLRMPVIEGTLYGIDAAKRGKFIVAVGAGGLIVASDDNGRSWYRGRVITMPQAQTSEPAVTSRARAALRSINPIAGAVADTIPLSFNRFKRDR